MTSERQPRMLNDFRCPRSHIRDTRCSGVHYTHGATTTQSIVMRSKSGTIRIDS